MPEEEELDGDTDIWTEPCECEWTLTNAKEMANSNSCSIEEQKWLRVTGCDIACLVKSKLMHIFYLG